MIQVKVTPTAKMVTDQVADAVSDLVRQLSHELLATLRNQRTSQVITPVKSGRARRGWKLRKRNDFQYKVFNKVPYINRLDEGYSKQAPNGIVRPAIKEVGKTFKRRRKK